MGNFTSRRESRRQIKQISSFLRNFFEEEELKVLIRNVTMRSAIEHLADEVSYSSKGRCVETFMSLVWQHDVLPLLVKELFSLRPHRYAEICDIISNRGESDSTVSASGPGRVGVRAGVVLAALGGVIAVAFALSSWVGSTHGWLDEKPSVVAVVDSVSTAIVAETQSLPVISGEALTNKEFARSSGCGDRAFHPPKHLPSIAIRVASRQVPGRDGWIRMSPNLSVGVVAEHVLEHDWMHLSAKQGAYIPPNMVTLHLGGDYFATTLTLRQLLASRGHGDPMDQRAQRSREGSVTSPGSVPSAIPNTPSKPAVGASPRVEVPLTTHNNPTSNDQSPFEIGPNPEAAGDGSFLASLPALQCPGIDDTCAHLTALPPKFGAREFSVELRVQFTAPIDSGDDEGGDKGFVLGTVDPSCRACTFALYFGDDGHLRWDVGNTILLIDPHRRHDDQWHDIFLVRRWQPDGAATYELWVDGEMADIDAVDRRSNLAMLWNDDEGRLVQPWLLRFDGQIEAICLWGGARSEWALERRTTCRAAHQDINDLDTAILFDDSPTCVTNEACIELSAGEISTTERERVSSRK